ncbi:flagellar hook-length control protein FliK [Candidatus Thiodiazotropha sp. CDECU1]|uniref:flagellar hook-length control protein FliK n=1 Tax=Candidatus Thiodiazotropha sp. CDECU1 TaxID=3065865 RepID=UPI00293170DB|nr:flagellar hook-length control protein FliK [Candidatus Thiodiazotropha sp. CDECU1]
MEIFGTKILLPLPTIEPGKSLLEQLQPGQIVRGTALSENVNGSMRLQIGVTRLIAQTTLSVPTGQALTLQVEKTGNLPELRVLTHPSMEQVKSAALKQVLPRQQPLPQLFQHLTQVAGDSNRATPLPPAVKQAVQSVLQRIVPIEDPGFKTQLLQALQLSGTHTEARLINRQVNNSDLKLNLLQLIGLIKPLISNPSNPINQLLSLQQQVLNPAQPAPANPPVTAHDASPTTKLLLDLFKHLDGAIARIQTNQLSSLPSEDSTRQVWQFELPIRHENSVDLFHFRISREDVNKGAEAAPMWSLTLHMNLPPLGPMRVRLALLDETISTIIWSEKTHTADLVNQHLDKLRAGLESTGLEVKKLEAFQGIAEIENELPSEQSLLNEQA